MSKNILLVVIVAAFSLSILFADEDIRNKYLVDKIYDYNNILISEYIYDNHNRLIKTIAADTLVESWRTIIRNWENEFEYENNRVSKIKHYSRYRDSGAGYDDEHRSETIIKYDSLGKPIKEEHNNFLFEDGFLTSTYRYDFGDLFYSDTVIYDDAMNNVVMRICESPKISDFLEPIPGTLRIDTLYFEYDNNPRPNFGIDQIYFYDPFPYTFGGEGELERMFSKNNMTASNRYTWIHTYNENGLPATIETRFGNNTYSSEFLRITYRKILGITENSIATHLTISPNPTSSNAIISFGLLEHSNITFEICDVLGNVFYTFSNFYDAGDHSVSFETKDLSNGSYIVRMLSNNKQIGSEKFAVVK